MSGTFTENITDEITKELKRRSLIDYVSDGLYNKLKGIIDKEFNKKMDERIAELKFQIKHYKKLRESFTRQEVMYQAYTTDIKGCKSGIAEFGRLKGDDE